MDPGLAILSSCAIWSPAEASFRRTNMDALPRISFPPRDNAMGVACLKLIKDKNAALIAHHSYILPGCIIFGVPAFYNMLTMCLPALNASCDARSRRRSSRRSSRRSPAANALVRINDLARQSTTAPAPTRSSASSFRFCRSLTRTRDRQFLLS